MFVFYTQTAFGQTSSPVDISPFPDAPALSARIEQSQLILEALFLERYNQYDRALGIWETLPQTSKLVGDHIFQNGLMEMKPLNFNSIPATESSVNVAVSYLKWQKRWAEAYQLLQERSQLVQRTEELRLMQIMLALYLRRYEDARQQLEAMSSRNIQGHLRLDLLWSWYHLLSGDREGLKRVLVELEENAFYYPASFVVVEGIGYSREEVKKNAMRALTRFPSDRELAERVISMLLRQGAIDDLEQVIAHQKGWNDSTVQMIYAEFYLQSGRFEELKQLLIKIQNTEANQIELLEYRAQVAIYEKDWTALKHIAETYRLRFPFLKDGFLYMTMAEARSDG